MLLPLIVSTVATAPGDLTVVQKVEVLAANPTTKRAAIRLTTTLDPRYGADEASEKPPISCGYPGLPKGSTSGVTLLVWSFERSAVLKQFVVYGVAQERDECTSRAESTKQLAEAKKAFVAAGLDLTTPPSRPDLSAKQCRFEKKNEDDECAWTSTETCTLHGVVISTDEEQANCGPFMQTARDRSWYAVGDSYFFVDVLHTNSMRGSWDEWAVSALVVVPARKPARTPP